MSVRPAVWDDIPRLISYLCKFHQLSPYADLAFSPGATRLLLQGLIKRPSACVFIHDHGAIAGEISPLRFGKGIAAQEIFWWAERNGIALLSAYEDWAVAKSADLISMIGLQDPRVAKIYGRRGYQPAEQTYLKGL